MALPTKIFLAICLTFAIFSSANAESLDALSLLKRDLGESIQVHTRQEIWYCPDNTCEMYITNKPHPDFASFVYLHLYHASGYAYLTESFGNAESFRKKAAEEPKIRAAMSKYCPKDPTDPFCILTNLKEKLGISLCSGRYDEDYFCYGCKEKENICKKY